jgi:hypothetical protein
LGHSLRIFTEIYAHEFEAAQQGQQTRDDLEAAFG